MLKLGFIGFGKRASDVWSTFEPLGKCIIKAIADPRADEILAKKKDLLPDCTFYKTAEEMLEKETLDGVFIGTRCDLHTKYALLVAKYNLPLFLEKPVAITEEELKLLQTIPHMEKKTVVCFPLRRTAIVERVKEILAKGTVGEIAQVQAYNNVHYARGYYHDWYRDDSITGGLFLQKSTHDLDYINDIVGGTPKLLCAMESKQVFKGNYPPNKLCKTCEDAETCPESLINLEKYDPKYCRDHAKCCFAVDTGNHDSATILLQYDNGMHVAYTQNFIARKTAGKRGARFIGYKGTVEFDFKTKTITVIDHMSDHVEHITVESNGAHSGGDRALAENFIHIMEGTEESQAPLSQSILSAKLCLAARTSAQTKTFVEF